eukprot:311251_1
MQTLRSNKRQRIEGTVTWTRTEIAELIQTQGNKHKITTRSRNKNKAKFLKKISTKFKQVPNLTLERWLWNMQHGWIKDDHFKQIYTPEEQLYTETFDEQSNNGIENVAILQNKINKLETNK